MCKHFLFKISPTTGSLELLVWVTVVAITHHQVAKWCDWEVTSSLLLSCCTIYIFWGWNFKSVWRVLGKLPNDISSIRVNCLVEWSSPLCQEFSHALLFHVFLLFFFSQPSCHVEPVYCHWFTLHRTAVNSVMQPKLQFPNSLRKALRVKHMMPNCTTFHCKLSPSTKSKAMQHIIIPHLSSWCYISTQHTNLKPSLYSGPNCSLQFLWNSVLKGCHQNLLGKFSFDSFESCICMWNWGQTFIIFPKVT